MNWWRAHHGLPFDTKLALVARSLQARRTDVGMVWIALLDYASQADERGSIDGIDAEEIAFGLDLEVTEVERIIDGFYDRGMVLEDARITAWERRQPIREDLTAADRQRARRDRLRIVRDEDVVTQSHAESHQENRSSRTVTTDKIRTEQIREHPLTPSSEGAGEFAPSGSTQPSQADLLEQEIARAASAIHERHPKNRRDCGVAIIRKSLLQILKHRKVVGDDRVAYIRAIDCNHAACCASHDWLKDAGQYAKGLSNWLAPTRERYDVQPATGPEAPRMLLA